MTLAYHLLKRYSFDELRLVPQPVASLSTYLDSKQFKQDKNAAALQDSDKKSEMTLVFKIYGRFNKLSEEMCRG